MKKLIVTFALGAAAIAAPALAQAPAAGGGLMQHDQARADAQRRADMMFQMLDANRDGTVTRAEAQQTLAQFEASRGGGEGRGTGRIQRMIDLAFGNAQSITLQHFETQALARFDAMDLNRDGVVTAAERRQARQQRAESQPGATVPAVATPRAPAAVPPPPGQ